MANLCILTSAGVGVAVLISVLYKRSNQYQVELVHQPFHDVGYAPAHYSSDASLLTRERLAVVIGPGTDMHCRGQAMVEFTGRPMQKNLPSSQHCYNCLGWAMWERRHLVLSKEPVVNMQDKKDEIAAFLDLRRDMSQKVFAFDQNVFPNFVLYDTLPPSVDGEILHHNTIAFYFAEGLWSHAARYLEHVPNRSDIKGWTSKLNYDELVSHKDVSDLKALYGEVALYAVPAENM